MGKIICLITGEEAYAGNGGYTCRSISLLIHNFYKIQMLEFFSQVQQPAHK